MLIVYINSQVVLFSLYRSLKMTVKLKILAKNLVKKLAIMLAPFDHVVIFCSKICHLSIIMSVPHQSEAPVRGRTGFSKNRGSSCKRSLNLLP